MRKVYINVTVKLIVRADDDADINKVLDEMDYSFTDQTGTADIEDTEIVGHEIEDSK